MKYLKVILSLVTILLVVTLTLCTDEQQNKSELGENRLIYKIKFIDGYDLAKLLDEYIDKSSGMKVDYIQGINTVIITAPKDSHPILMKLIEQFDTKPREMELNIYIVTRCPKKYLAQKTSKTYTFLDDDFNKKMEILNSMNPDVKYEGYGKLTIPLTSKKDIKRSNWSFSFTKDSVTYKLNFFAHEIQITDNTIKFKNFTVLIFFENGKNDTLLEHSFDIDATSNKLMITGTSGYIFGKDSPEKLELIFWPKVIKD